MRHRRVRLAVLVAAGALLVVVVAGCSGGSGGLQATQDTASLSSAGDSPGGFTSDSTPTTDEATTERPPSSSTSSTSSTSTTTPPSSGGDHGPDYFASPSGNIGCYLDADQARCDVSDKTWTAPKPDTPCELDYGHGVMIQAGKYPVFTCAGDTTLGAPNVLAYGDTAQRGNLECASSEAGMTCTDVSSGHGFVVSRDSYALH